MMKFLTYFLILFAFPSAVLAEGHSHMRKDYLLYRLPQSYHADDIEVFHLVHSLLFPELELQISNSPPTTRDYADYYDTVVSIDNEYDEADQYVYLSTNNKRAALFHDYICMVQIAITYALHRRGLAEIQPDLPIKKEDTKLLLTHFLPAVLKLYKTDPATCCGREHSEQYLKIFATLPLKKEEQVASVVMYTSRGSEYLGLYCNVPSDDKLVLYNVFRIGASRKKTLKNWQDKRISLVVYPSIFRMQTFCDEIFDYFSSSVVISK